MANQILEIMARENGQGRIDQDNRQENQKGKKKNVSTQPSQDMDKLQRESEKNRTKKPGSQSNSGGSGRHNNGRGGGK